MQLEVLNTLERNDPDAKRCVDSSSSYSSELAWQGASGHGASSGSSSKELALKCFSKPWQPLPAQQQQQL
jgi:hypothetical protein